MLFGAITVPGALAWSTTGAECNSVAISTWPHQRSQLSPSTKPEKLFNAPFARPYRTHWRAGLGRNIDLICKKPRAIKLKLKHISVLVTDKNCSFSLAPKMGDTINTYFGEQNEYIVCIGIHVGLFCVFRSVICEDMPVTYNNTSWTINTSSGMINTMPIIETLSRWILRALRAWFLKHFFENLNRPKLET